MASTIDIIIVNWNTRQLLDDCLRSIARFNRAGMRVVVVDNGSTDGSVEMLRKQHPTVIVIRNETNQGFSRANNIAIATSGAEYLLLVNSDIVFHDDVAGGLASFLDDNPDAVACAPMLRLADGHLQAGVGGYQFTALNAWRYFTFLSKLFPQVLHGIFVDSDWAWKKRAPVPLDWLCGACLMVRRSAVAAAGSLCDGYFMYAEDVEWFDRLRMQGVPYLLPAIEVIHRKGASSLHEGTVSTHWLESVSGYIAGRYSAWQHRCFFAAACFGYALRWMCYSSVRSHATAAARRKAEMSAYAGFSLQKVFRR